MATDESSVSPCPPKLLADKVQECCVASSAHMIHKGQKLVANPHWQTHLYTTSETTNLSVTSNSSPSHNHSIMFAYLALTCQTAAH